jgi:hypothetical protein
MALSIVWDEGINTTCHPGSVLSGHVQLLAAKQQPLGQVAVTLAGRCKVRIERSNGQSKTYYYSKGYYFRRRQNLHEGDFTFQVGTYSWPFRFVIPPYAERGLVQSEKGKGDTFKSDCPWRGTYTADPHPLPASFNGPRKCSVEYYLKAELTPPRQGSGLFSRSIEEKVMLNFRPVMVESVPAFDQGFRIINQKFSIRTLKLLPEDSEERHSFRHKLKGVFQSSSLPELNLDVQVSIPRRVVANRGAGFPCMVSVSRRTTALEDTRQVPQSSVQVRRFELELRSHTEARTRYHKDHKREKTLLGAGSGAAIWIQNADDVDGGSKPACEAGRGEATAATNLGAMYRVRIPYGVTPNFSTYNIAHYHTLELKLRLECAGEVMNFDVPELQLEVTPEAGGVDPPAWEPPSANGGMSIERQSDLISPPSYGDTEESGPSSVRVQKAPPYANGRESSAESS